MRHALLAVTALLGLASPALAVDEPVNTRYYFECTDTNKVRNTSGAAPWTTTAPTASYTEGAGCGYLDANVNGAEPGNDVYDAVFEGRHTGPVNDLTVRLHDLLVGHYQTTILGTISFAAVLEVDGKVLFDSTDADPPHEAAATASSTGLTHEIDFTLRNLQLTDPGVHSYRLTISEPYSDTTGAWVFGAAEIPAGVEFNPAEPLGTEIYVNEPPYEEEPVGPAPSA